MHRPLRRMLIVTVTAFAVMITSIAPVGATTADQAIDVAPDRPIIDERPVPLPAPIELLKLRCRGTHDRDGMPGVICKWTRPSVNTAEVLVLERNSGDGFEPIWRTDNLRRRRYFDAKVEPGQRYRYRVRAYDARGQLVAASRANGAVVPVPDFAIMKLRCVGDIIPVRDVLSADIAHPGQKVAKCEWSGLDRKVEKFQLWRVVNRGHRELVGTYDATTLNAQDDSLPRDAHVVRYAVLALDGDEHIIGRSRVAKVRFPVIDATPLPAAETTSDRVG